MNTHKWYRGMMAAAALITTVALAALLGTQAGAFAQANDPGAAPAQPGVPGDPPEVAPEPPGPPPAPREAQAGRDDMRPRGRGWDRQGPPDGEFDRPERRGRGGRGGEYGEGRGPGRGGEFEGPRGRGGEFGDRQGPPPGARFREGGRDRFEDGGRPCPPEGRGEGRGMGPRMRHEGFDRPGPPDPEAIFDAMDKNHDGALSKEEFRTFHDQHRPPRPRMNDSDDARRPAPPQRPFPQDDRPQS